MKLEFDILDMELLLILIVLLNLLIVHYCYYCRLYWMMMMHLHHYRYRYFRVLNEVVPQERYRCLGNVYSRIDNELHQIHSVYWLTRANFLARAGRWVAIDTIGR